MTIPETNSKLLVTEDWKKLYQSNPNAEFQSYDFDTLRRILIAYLQENYPEDFNDYIESSEYIALVDLIAYLGQNLSFRIDLNARENFLETAERRDSILRLAQLISYVPKRNTPASGLLKINAISTTDSVFDSAGVNLANTTVLWNDATNPNWYEQFISVINSTLPRNFAFGSPNDRSTISGILTEQYKINSSNTDVPVYGFTKTINGTSMDFEMVSASIANGSSIAEETPSPGNKFGMIYQSDNQGNNSPNTGFFIHFKQGQLGVSTFNLTAPTSNELIGINISNINDTDVWLWQLDLNGNYTTLWTKVPAISGNNVVYNSIDQKERNIFSVLTRDLDQIDLNFADGNFGNLPQGTFALIYRQSNGLSYVITPSQMSGIVVNISYRNQFDQEHTLTLTLGLQYTISNSAPSESNDNIKLKAPQTYYTQNRMVTAEDYNIAPLNLSSDILKVKSVARVTSGVSKYFELSDVSGKYSSTNIFADDGILYKDTTEQSIDFLFDNKNDIWSFVKRTLEPLIKNVSLRSFYLDEYPKPGLLDLNLTWVRSSVNENISTGYLSNQNGPSNVGIFISNNLRYVTSGAMIKFVAPGSLPEGDPRRNTAKNYFKPNGSLVATKGSNGLTYVWSTVSQVIGDGSNTGLGALEDGTGPIILSNNVDNGAVPVGIIPKFVNAFTYAFQNEIVDLCLTQKNFGLTYDNFNREWAVISDINLDLENDFSLVNQNDLTGLSKDSSWLLAFVWQGDGYRIRNRITNFIFQSEKETSFYTDPDKVSFDYTNNKVIKDEINVLSINTVAGNNEQALGRDYTWQIDGNIIEIDGYVDPTKIKISFYDNNNSGELSDPDSFNNLSSSTNFVFYEYRNDGETTVPVDENLFVADYPDQEAAITAGNLIDGQIYYFYEENLFNVYNEVANEFQFNSTTSNYIAYPGRSNLKFQYTHNSGEDRRIDPGKSNIMDVYLLSASYDTAYRYWLSTGQGEEPLPPTSIGLENSYKSLLEPIKTISDEIIFQPVKYKILFGSKADISLRARFKAVKNPLSVSSESFIKSRIITAINDFFNLDNWDFGQSFYFSELSTYVMNIMTPDITNFIIVPNYPNNFGSLYEVTCLSNEIFINGATVAEIDIIDAVTASQLKATNIVTSSGS
jgi:hypothetical protein